jgi:hypothetical protein
MNTKITKLLSIGYFNNESNTSLHRHEALKSLISNVDSIAMDSKPVNLWYRIMYHLSYYKLPVCLPDICHVNEQILEKISSKNYDMIWIDKPVTIKPSTLQKIKKIQPNCKIVAYMCDDFMNPYHHSRLLIKSLPLYDFFIVNRQHNLPELRKYGCKYPICCFMSYESKYHYPRIVTDSDRIRLGGRIGFIGTYEKERADSICFLVDHGLDVRVWGNSWNKLKNYSKNLLIEGEGLYSKDYCKAISCFDINLCFLRKKSRDFHTQRSTEIPACGGFMLAERTDEHLALFEEGKEAAFFSSNEELLEKCRYYLTREEERKQIALAGTKRCGTSGYSNEEIVKQMLQHITVLDKMQNE